MAGVDDGGSVRPAVDVSAARQRAETVLDIAYGTPPLSIAHTLARDVVALADRVEAATERGDFMARERMRWRTRHKEVWERAVAAEERAAELEKALAEIHEYNCGCETPGSLDRCVAQPVVLFAALSSSASHDTEDDWQYTTERIDFAPIWSREDFERRAREEGWTSPDRDTKEETA